MSQLFYRNLQPVEQIIDQFKKELLIIDPSYQRRKVWLPPDKVRLVETILLNLVMPEVFFWPAETDPETGKTITHIVDGQQRIASIVEFVSNEFSLDSKHLLNDDIKVTCGNKLFSELSPEDKKRIWKYQISIVMIDSELSKNSIKEMFFRLNLTNYSLNAQEKLNSIDSAFGDAAEALSKLDFWKNSRVFSASDTRRMQDIRYCCSIYILAKEGVIDQTGDKRINDYYTDYANEFDSSKELYKKIVGAMDIITGLCDKSTQSFIYKKTQMYTLFSMALKIIDEDIPLPPKFDERFKSFVKAYNFFRNEYDITFDDDQLRKANEDIKKYKLASSEGLNKFSNRTIRLETLFKFCIDNSDDIINTMKKLESRYKEQAEINKIADAFDYEDLLDIDDIMQMKIDI
ncbi:MAG: DUF262 domain-containing protein [Defluviitaleaceae bacterium]|nr:DUF262 domain-containing protein [Defluviitaleaceae bacterium]